MNPLVKFSVGSVCPDIEAASVARVGLCCVWWFSGVEKFISDGEEWIRHSFGDDPDIVASSLRSSQ
jgi:hypothetical protein